MARELQAVASRIRGEADDHLRLTGQARWDSAAAEVYRQMAAEDRQRAYRVADRLTGAAQSVRRHAAEVEATWALVGRLDAAFAACLAEVSAWTR